MTLNSIHNLRALIHQELSSLITEDYVLLDIPNHKNIGDQLIYKGELDFFDSIPFKCISQSSVTFTFSDELKANTVLMHGGGNFGDLYPMHQRFREKVILKNPDKKIIVLPQSVHFKDEMEVLKSAAVFNEHPDLTICVRDQHSFDYVSKYFSGCTIVLMPDMAFSSHYKTSKEATKDLLVMKRRDFEVGDAGEIELSAEYNVSDWTTFEPSVKESLAKYYEKINNKLSRWFLRAIKKNSVFGLAPLRKEREYIQLGIDLVSSYKFVISTRLHGHILCLLLGIPSIIVDNSYGKNKRFYQAWLKDVEGSYFSDTIEEALVLYHTIKNGK
jgi:exopolysaccharide biosynthesis predicted pyruvyltransferase EpsI